MLLNPYSENLIWMFVCPYVYVYINVCVCVQEAWSDDEGRVMLDSQQDYELLDARNTPEGFSLLFRRPFSTCDPHDYIIEAL